jgi:hypothetical protein
MNVDDLLFVTIIAGVGLTGAQFRVEYLWRRRQRRGARAFTVSLRLEGGAKAAQHLRFGRHPARG